MTNISIFRKNKLLVKYEYFLSGTSTPPRMILDSIKKIKFSMDLCKLQMTRLFLYNSREKHFIKQKADKSLEHNSFDESQFNL